MPLTTLHNADDWAISPNLQQTKLRRYAAPQSAFDYRRGPIRPYVESRTAQFWRSFQKLDECGRIGLEQRREFEGLERPSGQRKRRDCFGVECVASRSYTRKNFGIKVQHRLRRNL